MVRAFRDIFLPGTDYSWNFLWDCRVCFYSLKRLGD
jgi:hypothetical protein